jgi:hypothetical protein
MLNISHFFNVETLHCISICDGNGSFLSDGDTFQTDTVVATIVVLTVVATIVVLTVVATILVI